MTVSELTLRRKCIYIMLCSYRKSHLTPTDIISADLILSELNGCEVTHFAVAATNQKRLIGWWPVFAVSQGSLLDSLSAFTWAAQPNCVLIGCSHGARPSLQRLQPQLQCTVLS